MAIGFKLRVGSGWDRVLGRSFKVEVTPEVPKRVLGGSYGSHCLCPLGLGRDSVVYSFGVGEDIPFDLALIREFGVTVHGFDPTPRALEFVKRSGPPDGFVMHPFALAARDGQALFHPPSNPAHVSHSLSQHPPFSERAIEVEVRRLPTLMKDLGHSQVDVLKLDIEGEEYPVITDLLEQQVDVRQLLVEFHHRFRTIGLKKTRDAVRALSQAGYRVFDVSASGREFSFLR